MIAVVVLSTGEEQFFLCRIDPTGALVDLDYSDDYGWEAESVDRWIDFSDVLAAIDAYNPPQGEKESK